MLRVFPIVLLVLFSFSAHQAEAGGALASAYLKMCQKALMPSDRWNEKIFLDAGYDSVFWIENTDDLDAATQSLVDAFQNDPLFLYMSRDPELREKLIRTLVRHAYFQGGVLSTKFLGEGAALWFNGQKASVGPLSLLLTGQAFLIPQFGFQQTMNLLKLDAFMAATRKRLLEDYPITQEVIHLPMIGVVPMAQGSGLGRTLLRPILDYADANNAVIILEVHKAANIEFYEHFNFTIRHQETFPEGAPMTTTMIREPMNFANFAGVVIEDTNIPQFLIDQFARLSTTRQRFKFGVYLIKNQPNLEPLFRSEIWQAMSPFIFQNVQDLMSRKFTYGTATCFAGHVKVLCFDLDGRIFRGLMRIGSFDPRNPTSMTLSQIQEL